MKKAERTEATVRARRRLAAVRSVASLVTHQARNRLSVLRGALEILAEGMEQNLSAEYRAALLRELDQFLGEFNLGADMVRSELGELAPASAREVAEEAFGAFRGRAESAGIDLQFESAAIPDRIRADRRLLRLALLNLLRNAMEALRDRPGGRIILRVAAAGGEVRLEVQDDGPGVSARLHDNLFLEAPAGTAVAGVGLTLARDAMLVMGGSIEYLTPKGSPGALFRLTIPLET